MDERFYTSTEASQITGCTRRQLQYWREKRVVVPTVNPSGKGRNVYYSESDLLALTVMEYLLSIGLSFEIVVEVLGILRNRESWLFNKSLSATELKRFMLLLDSQEEHLKLVDFDINLASDKLKEGFAVIPFWLDRIYEKLQDSLQDFNQRLGRINRTTKN